VMDEHALVAGWGKASTSKDTGYVTTFITSTAARVITKWRIW